MAEGKKQTTGEKLARLRKKKKIGLDELSERTGLKKVYLQEIESGKRRAPVGDLLSISRALTIDPDDLLDSPEESRDLKKKREQGFKKREDSYLYQVLTPKAKNRHLRAFHVTIPPLSEHPKINYRHEGEEFVYVLKGEVDISVGQKKHHLEKSETIHFNSGIKHSLRNPGRLETLLLVVVYTP